MISLFDFSFVFFFWGGQSLRENYGILVRSMTYIHDGNSTRAIIVFNILKFLRLCSLVPFCICALSPSPTPAKRFSSLICRAWLKKQKQHTHTHTHTHTPTHTHTHPHTHTHHPPYTHTHIQSFAVFRLRANGHTSPTGVCKRVEALQVSHDFITNFCHIIRKKNYYDTKHIP